MLRNGPASARQAGKPRGIDVSSHNHATAINWHSVASGGYSFAMIKATEGTGYVNPYFRSDYRGARWAGLYRGAYHFALPDRSGGATQANYFLDRVPAADRRTLPPALDIEYNPYGTNTCYGLSSGAMVYWISSFVRTVKARVGRAPLIYSTADWWNYCTGGSTRFGSNPLWVADYSSVSPRLPAGWSTWKLWQYTSTGRVPGITGYVDLDYYNGSLRDLQDLASR